MKVIVISPNPKSLYTTSLCSMLIKNNIEISAVFVKKFTLNRFKNEFSRDGLRLIKKIWNKLILGQLAYKKNNSDNIIKFRDLNNIKMDHVNELKKITPKYFMLTILIQLM